MRKQLISEAQRMQKLAGMPISEMALPEMARTAGTGGAYTITEKGEEILKQTNDEIDEIVFVSINNKEKGAIGTLNQLDQIIFIHQINEIIFCAKDTSSLTYRRNTSTLVIT